MPSDLTPAEAVKLAGEIREGSGTSPGQWNRFACNAASLAAYVEQRERQVREVLGEWLVTTDRLGDSGERFAARLMIVGVIQELGYDPDELAAEAAQRKESPHE